MDFPPCDLQHQLLTIHRFLISLLAKNWLYKIQPQKQGLSNRYKAILYSIIFDTNVPTSNDWND